MAEDKDAPEGEQPCCHEWRGVVEDFVALKPKEHSFECILTHTENLHDKLQMPGVDVATAVEGGAIGPLLDILALQDTRAGALLQRVALQTLTLILEKGSGRGYEALVTQAQGVPRLLHLLKLRRKDISDEALYILDLLQNGVQCAVIQDQESVECIIAGLGCTRRDTKEGLLRFIGAELQQFLNNLNNIPHRITDIVKLFRVENAYALHLLSKIFEAIAEGDSPNLRDALMSCGFLCKCKDIIHVVSQGDETDDAQDLLAGCFDSGVLLKTVKQCAEKNSRHALEVFKSGFVDCLYPFLDSNNENYGLANWILAYVVKAGDGSVLEELLRRKLVPSVQGILQLKASKEDEMLAMLLERFLVNSTTANSLLVPKFLQHLAGLVNFRQWEQLHKLLVTFKDALEAVQRQGRLAQVGPTLLQCYYSFDQLAALQDCIDMDISEIAVEVVEMLTTSL